MKIGIISDTHRMLHPRIWEVFRHVDHIIHAGDVGDYDILISLETLAPVTAVYGNCDGFTLRRKLKARACLQLQGFNLEITHIPDCEDYQDVHGTATDIKIFGHTHFGEVVQVGAVLVVNPGSASRPRGQAHPTVALLELQRGEAPRAEIRCLR